jgi:uncharacterized protein (TIGR00730 family)
MPTPYTKGPDQPLLKSYNNPEFINSPEARIIRILSEYLEPTGRFERHDVTGTVVFFGSARIIPPDVAEREIAAVERQVSQADGEHRELLLMTLAALKAKQGISRYYHDAVELSRMMTEWAQQHTPEGTSKRFLVCSGGGPGIMEAANLGAHMAGGESIGLNISLPFEQMPNQYISATLNFEFHYFFMRKLFFVNLANAMVVFPGGFGTLDEFMEVLTLVQTRKINKQMPIVLYGSSFWGEIINMKKMAEFGVISIEDLDLFYPTDNIQDAFNHLTTELSRIHMLETKS